MKKITMRKAMDGASIMLVGFSIGTLIIVSLYLISKNMQSKLNDTSNNVSSAIQEGVTLLQNN